MTASGSGADGPSSQHLAQGNTDITIPCTGRETWCIFGERLERSESASLEVRLRVVVGIFDD